MSTKGLGVVANADASRGAARPSTETPRTSATRSELPGVICAYADANTGNNAAGSSSKRSSDTHATGRSSVAAHSASRVDLP